jgi:hypothetical protein
MKTHKLWLEKLGSTTKIGLLLMMGASMSTCSATTMTWKEEVLLHDGAKIMSTRFYNLGGHPTDASRERQALDETVTFTPPGSENAITWKTDFRDAMPEPNSLNLLVLDIVNGIPYIATYPAGCIAYNKWKRPNPPYVFFKYVDLEWKQIPLQEFPTQLSRTNVIVGRPPAELLKPFYTVEQVNERNYYLGKEYKTILREPMKSEWCPQYPSVPKAPLPMTPSTSSK